MNYQHPSNHHHQVNLLVLPILMGVKDLNSFFSSERYRLPSNKPYHTIIFDGSNLVIRTLARQLKRLRESVSPDDPFMSINLTLTHQFGCLIKATVNDIATTIQTFANRHHASDIVVIFDPLKAPSYHITSDMIYDRRYSHYLIDHPISNEPVDDLDITLNIKDEERAIRRAASSKAESVMFTVDALRERAALDGRSDDYISTLISVFTQSYCFNDTGILARLSSIVAHLLHFRTFTNVTVSILYAVDEADLVIKNVACSLNVDDPILIVSMDTDYMILFADSPNIDVGDLNSPMIVRNPHSCWVHKLGAAFSYDIVVRLSAIFGNDYTVHDHLISAKRGQHALDLLNIDRRFDELKLNRRTKIAKVVSHREVGLDILTPSQLDEIIASWNNTKYFRQYLVTTIVYTNWRGFGEYEELNVEDDDSIYYGMMETLMSIGRSYGKMYGWYGEDDEGRWLDVMEWDERRELMSDEMMETVTVKRLRSMMDVKVAFNETVMTCDMKVDDMVGCEFVEDDGVERYDEDEYVEGMEFM